MEKFARRAAQKQRHCTLAKSMSPVKCLHRGEPLLAGLPEKFRKASYFGRRRSTGEKSSCPVALVLRAREFTRFTLRWACGKFPNRGF